MLRCSYQIRYNAMKNHWLFFMILASLMFAGTSQAQLGWTLEQCKAKYGESVKDKGQPEYQSEVIKELRGFDLKNDVEFFKVGAFKVGIAFLNDSAFAIAYEPKDPISDQQAREILAKHTKSAWKKVPELSDESMQSLSSKGTTHELTADVYFDLVTMTPEKYDRNQITGITVFDETVKQQVFSRIQSESDKEEAAQSKKIQSNVDGL
jgi:hypothetical protein